MTDQLNERTILLIKSRPINDIRTRKKNKNRNNGIALFVGIVILILFYILLKKYKM